MNLETAIALVDAIIFESGGQHLRASEVIILQGSLQGFTYDQMSEASEYSTNYLMRDAAPKFWKRLSKALGEPVYKTNIRSILERMSLSSTFTSRYLQLQPESDVAASYLTTSEAQPQAMPMLKLVQSDVYETAPAPFFYGRASELTTLNQWIIEEQTRLCGVWGLSGIGKTALLKQAIRQLHEHFDVVLLRSLSQAPSLTGLLNSFVTSSELAHAEAQQWSALMTAMSRQSCLLILDDVESILDPKQLSGHYREGYENYGEFFQYFAEASHRSCLVLISLEPVRMFTQMQATRSLHLSGLSKEASCALSEAMQLKKTKAWDQLTEIFQGHPAALKITAKLIRDLFGGNVAEFLAQQSFMFAELEQCLRPSLERLSTLEQEVLYELATQERPIAVSQFELTVRSVQLLEVLESLRRRSLLQVQQVEGQSFFSLPSMISTYVMRQLLTQISNDQGVRSPSFPLLQEGTLSLSPILSQPATLSQWFENNFSPTWQPIDALFDQNSDPTALKLRRVLHLRHQETVKRCKQIWVGKKPMILLIAIEQDANQIYKISVQVQPTSDTVMAAGVTLNLLSQANQTLATIVSKVADSFIQLPYFWGHLQEPFNIQVSLKQNSHVEAFVI